MSTCIGYACRRSLNVEVPPPWTKRALHVSRFNCIVAFAAGSGSRAFQPEGTIAHKHSYFSAALLDCISSRGHLDDMRTLLQDHVRASVVDATRGAQVPWVTTSMDPAPRYLLQLGSNLALHSTLAPGVTLGEVVGPLVAAIEDQVC